MVSNAGNSNGSNGHSKETVAARLASAHRIADPDITEIYRVFSPLREEIDSEPLKLLEVNPNTTVSGIVPIGLTAHAPSGIYYKSVVIEVHPSELDAIKSGNLRLPNEWTVNFENPL